ncbi:MAG: ABC transporter ATP-binding protein [Chloroflexi bacterium]|nr:ABC transporter ATP-binding protein [Chloroflexota bacterium]
MIDGNLLSLAELRTYFFHSAGAVRVVDGVTFSLKLGKTLGLVGESGAGKSMTGRSILRLLPPSARTVGGRIIFQGTDLLTLSERALRELRGREIATIPQDPLSSLNPAFRIGGQMTDVMQRHLGLNKSEARERAVGLLARVGIPAPETAMNKYPHQLSGGMRQRVMISIAFSCEPALVIADEPTSALDMTMQAQIIAVLNEMKVKSHTSMIFITHDLALVSKICDDVVVMYAGRVVERAPVTDLFTAPAHPYTRALMRAVPRFDIPSGMLYSIEGSAPQLSTLPPGCPFEPRCPERIHGLCREARAVPWVEIAPDRGVACWQHVKEA